LVNKIKGLFELMVSIPVSIGNAAKNNALEISLELVTKSGGKVSSVQV